jgi:transcriptional regulator with XRE-family HTH domain
MIVRLVNNQMRELREEAGLTQGQLADRIGIHLQDYNGLEAMRDKPVDKKGRWRSCALAISEYHGMAPEDLFPDVVLGVERAVVERKLDAAEICSLLPSYSERAAMGPESMLLAASKEEELSREVGEVVGTLTPREQEILRNHFGLEGARERSGSLPDSGNYSRAHTLDDLSVRLGVSSERIRAIEAKALRKMRHPQRSKRLRKLVGPS